MSDQSKFIVAPLARWSSRIALFSASLLLVGLFLHRFLSLPTPVALNLFAVGLGGAALALLVGLIAFVQIWRKGYGGAGSAAVGILLPLLLLGWPFAYVSAYSRLPRISDISTDVRAPPRLVATAALRDKGMNPAAYPGEQAAAEQLKAYPDLRTFVMDRPAEEAFELVEEAVRRLKWRVIASEAASVRPLKPGVIEATDQTMIIGFIDDIVIRVEGNASRSRVDVRSASRYGSFDLGQNATRVRRFLTELQARVDSTSPSAVAGRRGLRTTRAGAMVKKGKAADQAKADARPGRDRARPGAQRARGPKE